MQSLHAYKAKKASKLHARGKSDSWNTVNLMKQCSSCWQETASAAVRSCCHKGCSGPSQRRAHGNPSPATQIWPTTHLNCLATYCVRPGHSIPALPPSCPQARKAPPGSNFKNNLCIVFIAVASLRPDLCVSLPPMCESHRIGLLRQPMTQFDTSKQCCSTSSHGLKSSCADCGSICAQSVALDVLTQFCANSL